MAESRGRHIISSLQKKWTGLILFTCLLCTVALTLMVSAAILLLHLHWLFIPTAFVLLTALTFFFAYQKINETDIAGFLNSELPELQESTGLLLKPYEQLNPLEKLQLNTIEQAITPGIRSPKKLIRNLRTALLFFLAALVLSVAAYILPGPANRLPKGTGINSLEKFEKKLPQVDKLNITIIPPAYTGKSSRQQQRFNVSVEEAGSLSWHINTNIAVKEIALVFNDKSILPLTPGKNNTQWSVSKQVRTPGFYQLRIDGTLSELYRVEMIRDQLPAILVRSPKPSMVIEPGQSQRAQLSVSVSDDYGIKKAFISATMASGNGESVRFKETQMPFGDLAGANKEYQLQKQLDLRSMGMKPGDELYLYVSATDTYGQEKRSDIYIIRIEDTTQLMSIEGLISGTDIKPEFFRSQRQIIIETEQLLKAADTMSATRFRDLSNNLGIDQKLLRLRYSKFLGEETDEEIGHVHEEGVPDPADFGNAQKMMDEVAHKHDVAEDATFFDAQTKKQLKATLAEMWKAELELRTIKPKDALPFEYKALKLLKELQQQSRVYVAKTGTKTTPLKPEKRLTGELDKISQPVQQQSFPPLNDEALVSRKALGILEQVKNKETLQPDAKEILVQAGRQLGMKAAAEPAIYLSSYEAMGRIMQDKFSYKDIVLAGAALQRMIQSVSKQPQQAIGTGKQLSQKYFMNLNRQHD
jgi:hypothetical protein